MKLYGIQIESLYLLVRILALWERADGERTVRKTRCY